MERNSGDFRASCEAKFRHLSRVYFELRLPRYRIIDVDTPLLPLRNATNSLFSADRDINPPRRPLSCTLRLYVKIFDPVTRIRA